MNEVWKAIEGYEGKYEVSNLGRVASLNYNREGRRKIIATYTNSNSEYLNVQLWKNNKKKGFRVNRLVAQAFIPNPNNLPQVNHKNEIKTDNRVENLEWCTAEYNVNYGTRSERSGRAVIATLPDGTEEWYPTMAEAARQLYAGPSQVSAVLYGFRKKFRNRTWRYADK